MDSLPDRIRACRLCAGRFAATATAHAPRPVVWFAPGASVLISGQAPGARVHASGQPFTDPSGDRLRDWLGIDATTFYDRSRIAIVPAAFCFPGYDAKGSDLQPPRTLPRHLGRGSGCGAAEYPPARPCGQLCPSPPP